MMKMSTATPKSWCSPATSLQNQTIQSSGLVLKEQNRSQVSQNHRDPRAQWHWEVRRGFQLELGKWSQFKEEVVVIDSEYLASDHKITTSKVVCNPTSQVLGFSKAPKFSIPSWWHLDTNVIATTILEEAKQGLRKSRKLLHFTMLRKSQTVSRGRMTSFPTFLQSALRGLAVFQELAKGWNIASLVSPLFLPHPLFSPFFISSLLFMCVHVSSLLFVHCQHFL